MKLLHQGNYRFHFFQPKTLDYPMHLHNAVEIVFLKRGSADVLCGSSRIHLAPGDAFVCFPNRVHGYENSEAVDGYVLIVPMNPYLAAFHSTLDQTLPQDPMLRRGQWEHTGLPRLLDMLWQDREATSRHIVQGYLLVIVGKLLSLLTLEPVSSGNADVLQSALLFLNDHYKDPLTRTDIAKAVGCNESYISHLFSQALKTSLTDYIVSLRMGDALELLSQTTLPVSQIALSLGFGSIRSFNRVFQKEMHISPTAYRKAAKR